MKATLESLKEKNTVLSYECVNDGMGASKALNLLLRIESVYHGN